MAAGDLFRVTINTSAPGSELQNVIYYSVVSDDGAEPNIEAIAGEVLVVIVPPMQVLVSDQALIECMDIQKVFPVPEQALQEFNIDGQGQATGEMLPATVSYLIQKINFAATGKGKKGRFYLGAISEAGQDRGRVINPTFVELGVLATRLAENLASPGGGDYQAAWAVRNTVAPFQIVGFEAVDKATPLPRTATQRRRRTRIRTPA